MFEFDKIASRSTFNYILSYLNQIAKHCNLEGECTCTSGLSEVHSFPNNEHIVLNNSVEYTDQDPINAIKCIDDLELKVTSVPANPISNFLSQIETPSFEGNCSYDYIQTNNVNLNQNFILGYADQFAQSPRTAYCGTGYLNTNPCFDYFFGSITATVFDLTYCNSPNGYLETIKPVGLKIEQNLKVNAELSRLKVYQGIYLWNHLYSYWFGNSCGFISGNCKENNTEEACNPCFVKLHPYDEINSSYRCDGTLLSPPACSENLTCPPFTQGTVNWNYILNSSCYDVNEFVRKEDGNVKALFLTYSNIENSNYEVLYNYISAKPSYEEPENILISCNKNCSECTIKIKFKTYTIPDKLIIFFDYDQDGNISSDDFIIEETEFISTYNEFEEWTLKFSENPSTDEFDINDLCYLNVCVIGNDDPGTQWIIVIEGCHIDPPIHKSGSSEGYCMILSDSDGGSDKNEFTTDGITSGIVVSYDDFDSIDNENNQNEQTLICYKCNSGNCDGVNVLADLNETCEDYGLYTDSATCNEECTNDGENGSDSGPI